MRMAHSGWLSIVRSAGSTGGMILLVAAGAGVVVTAAIALLVLAIGGGIAAVTGAAAIGIMEITDAWNETVIHQVENTMTGPEVGLDLEPDLEPDLDLGSLPESESELAPSRSEPLPGSASF